MLYYCFHRFTFCAEESEISPGQEITFIKCRDGWEVKPRKRYVCMSTIHIMLSIHIH